MPYDPLVSHGVSPSLPLAESYWHATHKLETLPPLSKDISSDYLVIGGGYTGLSAAMTLAEASQQVALLDANSLGFGCAGRNGGFILSGSGRLSLSAIENRWGYAVAKGMQAEFDGAVNLLNQRIADFDMHVDLVKGPYLKLAHSPKQANLLCDSAKHHESQFNVASTLLSQEDLTSRFGIKGAFGGVEVNGACLHPLKLVSEYARVAKALGASLYYDSPATHIEKHKTGYVVTTPNGSVSAKHILIATNAYTPKRFHDAVDNKQFPVQSSIFVTAPMNEEQRAQTGLTAPMSFMDTRMMKYYYRVLPDGRLLFGGRGAVTGKGADNSSEKQRLYNAMVKSFPALNSIAMDYFWSGWVSVSLDSMPRIFVDNDASNNNIHRSGCTIAYAMGYCGSGVSFAAFAGQRLAQRMLGSCDVDLSLPLYCSPLKTYPFAKARRLALHGLYQWAKFAER
ncbi:NAD(P)/FAD-dependent oxidoreductase [Alteromonas gracilis]|uniref:Oxidoreductase n=1 Tax=Alteromonas gracilis TaxID=1479524 RepID=A0ABX5CSM2_9ALTE|nr:FAD-dependent oxidoreductase [Alteromonas gracilis]PRO70582.1 oxidoreductase [Alteromonas gracilis]